MCCPTGVGTHTAAARLPSPTGQRHSIIDFECQGEPLAAVGERRGVHAADGLEATHATHNQRQDTGPASSHDENGNEVVASQWPSLVVHLAACVYHVHVIELRICRVAFVYV